MGKKSSYANINQDELQQCKVQLRDVDSDLEQLFLFSNGRVRFGDGADKARGENISGEFHTYTTNGTPDTEDTIAHTLGSIPVGYIVISQNKAASLYRGSSAWDNTKIYLKCNVASVAVKIFLLK